jgi:hypothetical protein
MTKRLFTSSLLAALVFAAAVSTGFAMPSIGGPTGIVSVPTAEVAPVGEIQTALTYLSQQMYGADVDCWGLNVLAGVSEGAELWGAYATAKVDSPTIPVDANMWGFGGKYQLASEPEDSASLAIGASYEMWSDLISAVDMYGDADVFKAYLVATKDFSSMADEDWEWSDGGTRILGSLGILYLDIDIDGVGGDLTEPFVGFEFIGAGGTSLGLEYRLAGDIDVDDVFSAVLTHPFSPEFEVQIGTTNAGPSGIGLDDQDFFVRLGYTFGLGEE